MRLLLDTQILLWWLFKTEDLNDKMVRLISDKSNQIFVSAASVWEISIKTTLGKLKAPSDLEDQISANGFEKLPVDFKHAIMVGNLPRHHNDPFDRMLIAQAQCENLIFMSADKQMRRYEVVMARI